MARTKPINQLPVNQRELANYLGISLSMLNMSRVENYPAHYRRDCLKSWPVLP
ncbi:MAG TPA: hypothetical protein VK489_02485 [Ferruginibacter sp.]|nr:hypothetical protein [Ferruginibacter sp.]